jgi:localization factor PodJL
MDVVGDYSNEMQAPEIEPEANGIPSPAQLTLESAASNGDEVAQFQLGLSHLEAGRNAEAVRLIRLSANQGQAAAQYRLAKLYENGVGVEKDLSAAMKLLERSAKGGNRIAMHDLGHYYATGAATSQPEISKAVTWFQQAAERGVLDSQFNLGVLYQEGSGVPKSEIEAYVWYTIAGAQGDTMAVQRADILAREMSEPQIEQAKSRVKAYVPARIDDAANGVFGKLPWAKPATDRMARVNTDVKKAQQLLSDLGYNVGAPDGAIGPKTRNAIITFEKSNGLPQTGRVSAELMDRLSLAAGV